MLKNRHTGLEIHLPLLTHRPGLTPAGSALYHQCDHFPTHELMVATATCASDVACFSLPYPPAGSLDS